MYFKEKGNTNIDSEFKNNKRLNFNFENVNFKPILNVAGIVIALVIAIIFIVSMINKNNKYILELIGPEKITMTVGEDYIELGYKAYDKNKNDYTASVSITSNLDTSKVGNYEILYSINNVKKVRYIVVKEKIDETYIRLKGNINMYLELGEKYIEPGYEAFDSIDQGLTNKVKVSGTVNTSKTGIYQLTYSVVNSRNKITTVTRNIIVVEKGQKR